MSDIRERTAEDTIDATVRRLSSVAHFRAGSLVTMPVLYPSGSTVVLEVHARGDRFFVSDRGGGHLEADLLGVSGHFSREAERIAKEAGIGFDGRDMFVAEVSSKLIGGAMTVVANSSQLAVSSCAMSAGNRAEREDRDFLFERLKELFPGDQIDRDARFQGSSSHRWKVAALVTQNKHAAAFDIVSNHYNSVVGTAAKFHDIARLEYRPARIAVVRNKAALGSFIGVLAPASTAILEITASNEAFKRLVAA